MNKVILIGNVGKVPEVKTFPEGGMLATFSLATSERYKKDTEWITKTEWHDIEVWGKIATVVEKYVHQGSKLAIEGKIKKDMWEKDGVKNYRTKIVLKELELLDKKGESSMAPPADNPKRDDKANDGVGF